MEIAMKKSVLVLSLFLITPFLRGHSNNWSKPGKNRSLITDTMIQSQVYSPYMLQNREMTYRDERLLDMRSLESIYKLPNYKNLSEWETKKKYLKEHILTVSGLWPMPEKTPLNPVVYKTVEHADYTVQTVTIETYPGFFLGGNLYLPKGDGPFPGILTPHGHFSYGRLTDDDIVSVPGRAINFAKRGYVVFAYDMVGYNDTRQVNHQFADDSLSVLYGINLLGLQLWNSIRAMDYVENLEEVDPENLGITGASGGGTQTYLLTAVDNRFKVAAPVNMVSDHMQGGDLCENAPGLRLNTFNVEIAACIAPKPLLLISDTYDWTYNTRNTIMPMMKSIYNLYDSEDKLKNAHFDFKHNYNQPAREAVYGWFEKWIQQNGDSSPSAEISYEVEDDSNLLAFMKKKKEDNKTSFEDMPADEYNDLPNQLNEEQFKEQLRKMYSAQLQSNWPHDEQKWNAFKKQYGTALKHLLGVEVPQQVQYKNMGRVETNQYTLSKGLLSDKDKNHWIPVIHFESAKASKGTIILLADEGKKHWFSAEQEEPSELVIKLLEEGFNVLMPDLFKQGEHVLQEGTETRRDEHTRFFTTYNPTDRQEQIRDVLTLITGLTQKDKDKKTIHLFGTGNAGLTGLLASALTDQLSKVVVDENQIDPDNDQEMMKIQIPGFMRIGGLRTILALLQDQNILVYNVHSHLKDAIDGQTYRLDKKKNSMFKIWSHLPETGKLLSYFL